MNAIFLILDGKPVGPYTLEQLQQAIDKGQISRSTLAWHKGLNEWVVAGSLLPKTPSPASAPPPAPPVAAATVPPTRGTTQTAPRTKPIPVALIIAVSSLLVAFAGTILFWVLAFQMMTKSRLAETDSSSDSVVQAIPPVDSKTAALLVGSWGKISGDGPDSITIEAQGDQFLLTDGTNKVVTVLKDDSLMAGSVAAITYIKSSDHITTFGGGEYSRQSPLQAFITQGTNAVMTKDFDQAIADFNQALQLDPKNTDAYIGRGNAYGGQHDYTRAMADYTVAIQISPNNEAAYSQRGDIYFSTGAFDNAIADETNALKINPVDADTFQERGAAYYADLRLTEAEADFKQYLSLQYPNGAKLDNFGLYACYFICLIEVEQTHQMTGPAQELTAAMQNYSDDDNSWTPNIGRFLLGNLSEDGLLKEAATAPMDADHDTTVNQQNCEAYFYIGMKHFLGGDTAGAKAFFQKTVATNTISPVDDYFEYQSAKNRLAHMN